ncbi:MAG TPA: phosphate ABC transporter substrate-binding protein PstS [Rhizomicrobium sp.]|nr:phosphate ABC transporter substrate-binding protein PstS [Rhizomicrobium sp.]
MKPVLNRLAGIALAVGLAGAASVASAADITGAGSTFAYPIYSKWAEAYKAQSGVGLNYQSIGSGGGIAQIKAKTVTFGASDMPLNAGDLDAAGFSQFPTVIGGVAPVVNLPGIKPGEMVLDGPTLANIYMGKITKWNDPAIKKLNPNVNLPATAIAVVHRSDGSGTTYIFTNYLSKVSPAWATNVGTATAVEWPVGIGAKGSEGVAGNVKQTVGGIGYVEYAYIKQNNQTYTRMINRDGATVSPTAEAFQAASAKADWKHAVGFNLMLTNQSGKDSWPIAGATFVLVYKNPPDANAQKEALKFFRWGYQNGDSLAAGLDYVPLPQTTKDAILKSWKDNIVPASVP